MEYETFTDEELVKFLYIEEDRLPRRAADEFIRRGVKMVPLLSEIVSSQFSWTREPPEWWAVVHASFILGAVGTESTVIPLLRALRWADAFDCDWVNEALPAMLGRIGTPAVEPLKAMAADPTNGQFCRSTAMSALAVITRHCAEAKDDISVFIHSLFADDSNDIETRQIAGSTLLDMKCAQYKEELMAFAREERERKDRDPQYGADFFQDDVETALAEDSRDLDIYDRDWLIFYDEAEIAARQERWRREAEEERMERETADMDAAGSGTPGGQLLLTKTKAGRNDPCPCGSGKKYKKCCLGREH